MLVNPRHALQKIANNVPVAVTANEFTTAVVTNGGNVYQSGLISGKVKSHFQEIFTNEAFVGDVVDAEATENKVYLLNKDGYVFEYENKSCSKGVSVREVYTPSACGGDKAVKIAAGKAHVLILTDKGKVYGAGSNEQYQIQPQGQCKYDTATQILITDTVVHDDKSCDSFTGVYNELHCPKLPETVNDCDVSCVKNSLCDHFIGYLNVPGVTIAPINQTGTLSVPLYADIGYVGFLCVDSHGCASGRVDWTITRLAIKCGAFKSRFTWGDEVGCHTREFSTSSTTEIVLYAGRNCPAANSDLCAGSELAISGSGPISGKCGSCAILNIDIGTAVVTPTVAFDADCATIVLTANGLRTSIAALCDTTFIGLDGAGSGFTLDVDVPLKCKAPCDKPEPELPQPCWAGVYAGHNISVLVDTCDRLYVLGSLHEVRSNKHLLTKTGLSELLDGVNTSISFPADQLNCGKRCSNVNACRCDGCAQPKFKTDLAKFGICLSFPSGESECREKRMNACEFLEKLKKHNDADFCGNTCEPCEGYVYLNIDNGCSHADVTIGSVTIINKRSVSKLVSVGKSDCVVVQVDVNSVVDFDLNKYCIDAHDYPLEKVIKLDFCNDGKEVILYVDIDQPGGIKFESSSREANVEFTVSASTDRHQFILNYGSILDPVELANLKYALSLDCYFPSAQYKNPFNTKITNTYLRGGDHIRFVSANPKNIRQAVTADIPTVFRIGKKVFNVAVGNNNLTTLVAGGRSCPNEVLAIGSNCHGELGIGSHQNITCWKQVSRCFNCQVAGVFAGDKVTFYITQSNHVYAAGRWRGLVQCATPEPIKSICNSWKIRHIAATSTHIVFMGSDGFLFGVGDNSMGELGLGHVKCVEFPEPLMFFRDLDNRGMRQFSDCFQGPPADKCVNGPPACGRKPFKPYFPNARLGGRC